MPSQRATSQNQQIVSADVCVVGAGAAGLTFARECIGAGFSVVVLEGGEWERDERAQDLAAAHVDSAHYTPDAVQKG